MITLGNTKSVLVVALVLSLMLLGSLSTAQAGWFKFEIENDSNIAWSDFHVEIIAIPGYSYDISNVTFAVEDPKEPMSSQGLDSGNEWVLSSDKRKLDFNFYGDLYMPGEKSGYWMAYVNNPDGVVHGITMYPSVVPEPISSALFIIGGATLGIRRFMKKKLV